MSKYFYTTLLCLGLLAGKAQTTISFEEIQIEVDTFLDGSDLSNGFEINEIFFPNEYSTEFGGFWNGGWAISSKLDSVTSGFMNQFSAKTAGGFDGSPNYAVALRIATIDLTESVQINSVSGLYITNSTYAYNSMRDGDQFAKKFGGDSGEEPDFFKIIIKKWLDGEVSQDSIEFYLADYRFDDNSQDYILDEWTFLDLSSLGMADSLTFDFASSDSGANGINTPKYFCIDQISFDFLSNVNSPIPTVEIKFFPNPARDWLQVHLEDYEYQQGQISIFNSQGQLVLQKSASGNEPINIHPLKSGQYLLHWRSQEDFGTQVFIKQ